jgi:hypothetical protein
VHKVILGEHKANVNSNLQFFAIGNVSSIARSSCIYNQIMKIDFDPAKNEKNIPERGLPFTLAAEFD